MARCELQEVWCAIPVYNNAGTLRDVVVRTLEQVRNVMVIDDGSTDTDTEQLLAGLDITLIRHETNRGKGAALLTAMRAATDRGGKFLATLDADGQHYPEDIPAFLSQMDERTLLIGRRTEVHGVMPGRSRFGRAFSDFWIRVETGEPVSDTQSGFRVYPLEPISRLALRSDGYHFEVEVVTRALWAGLRVRSVPIRVWYAEADKRVSSFRPVADNLRISWLHARLVFEQAIAIRRCRCAGESDGRRMMFEHATPLGLSAAGALGMLIGALPWLLPRWVLLLWLSWRWHLNKPTAVLFGALGMLPVVPWLCMIAGRWMLGRTVDAGGAWSWWPYPSQQWWPWLLGSMVVGPVLAGIVAMIMYRIVLRFSNGEREP